MTDFETGWAAALQAAKEWHEAKAKQALVAARRSRFPKNYERESEWHRQCAERVLEIEPEPR
jgi:hypothetical protein